MKIPGLIIICMGLSTVAAHAQDLQSGLNQQQTKKSKVRVNLAIGTLNGGGYNGSLDDLLGTPVGDVPYRLYYPERTELLLLGISGPLHRSEWLHGFFNVGAPLRDIRMDVGSGKQTLTEGLGVATMFMDFGLSFYPLNAKNPNARLQPFIQGGLGLNVVADDWGVILLLGLSGDSSNTPQSANPLAERINADLMFSYGGGFDYYFTNTSGLRLSVRRLRLNLPDGGWYFSPVEISLGVVVR